MTKLWILGFLFLTSKGFAEDIFETADQAMGAVTPPPPAKKESKGFSLFPSKKDPDPKGLKAQTDAAMKIVKKSDDFTVKIPYCVVPTERICEMPKKGFCVCGKRGKVKK